MNREEGAPGRKGELKCYPTCCTSAYCGKGPSSCPACVNYPTQQAFKAWKEATAAVCDDPIWCPLVYTATHDEVKP